MALGVWFNKRGLQNNLVICLSDEASDEVLRNDQITLYKNKGVIICVVINDTELTKSLKEGFLLPSSELIDVINKKYNIQVQFEKNTLLKVALIEDAEQIPGTSYKLCSIKTDLGQHKIVCGANNVYKGMKTVVALNNVYIPNGDLIKSAKVGSTLSDGMLCSKSELALNSNLKGIVELSKDHKLQDFLEVYK